MGQCGRAGEVTSFLTSAATTQYNCADAAAIARRAQARAGLSRAGARRAGLLLEQAIVVPALPVVQPVRHITAGRGVWIITAFLLTAAIATPLAGRLGDRFGRRRVLEWSLVAFVIGSLSARSRTRSRRSLPAGCSGPRRGRRPARGIARARARGGGPSPRAIGLIVGAGGVGGVIGLLGGALLVDHVSVQSIFWLLGATALACSSPSAWPCRSPPAADGCPSTGPARDSGRSFARCRSRSPRATPGAGARRECWGCSPACAPLTGFVVRERIAAAPLLDPRGLARRPLWSAHSRRSSSDRPVGGLRADSVPGRAA